MSIHTIHTAPSGSPAERRDHATGRADAYDQHNRGATITELRTRLEWLEDPRVSAYTTAYLAGYRDLIADLAAEARHRQLVDTALAYDHHTTRKATR